MRPFPSLLALIPLLAVAVSTVAPAAELTIFAATSLSDVLREAGPAFSTATGDRLRFNFAASGTLARQIKDGAPADLFISADEPRLDQLIKAKLLIADTRHTLLANTLVIVSREDSPKPRSLADLENASFRRIAIGDPATVPAGTYAKQHLDRLGLWSALEPKLLPVDSVRAALAAVESGNAECGFVYKTDALTSQKVKIALEVPHSEGPRIVYPAAVVTDSKHPEAAATFLAWLAAPEAQEIFAKHGFLPTPPENPSVFSVPSVGTPSDPR